MNTNLEAVEEAEALTLVGGFLQTYFSPWRLTAVHCSSLQADKQRGEYDSQVNERKEKHKMYVCNSFFMKDRLFKWVFFESSWL